MKPAQQTTDPAPVAERARVFLGDSGFHAWAYSAVILAGDDAPRCSSCGLPGMAVRDLAAVLQVANAVCCGGKR